MATAHAVNAGSKYCRACGGPIESRGGLAWCVNRPDLGTQKVPLERCANLSKQKRRFCEHCGDRVDGLRAPCGHQPTHP